MSNQGYNQRWTEFGELFAQVDAAFAVQDHWPYETCVRLIGITQESYSHFEAMTQAEPQPTTHTFMIDVSLRDIFMSLGRSSSTKLLYEKVADAAEATGEQARWFKIKFRQTKSSTGSYFYELFANADPVYVELEGLESIDSGPPVPPHPTVTPGPSLHSLSIGRLGPQLFTFHCGQGMCSLIRDGFSGVLLDAGAGTPVTRDAYRTGRHADGRSFRNDLLTKRSGLKSLTLVLSHPDSDHWRLLDWDAALLDSIQDIYVPVGVPALALKSPHVIDKVTSAHSITIGGAAQVEAHRSAPKKPDKNGECLVACVRTDKGTYLFPGDYVYTRMRDDRNPAVSLLLDEQFRAVVVPHHGDSKSGFFVPEPAFPGGSVAFFSAGNHRGYGHPTELSLALHRESGYVVVAESYHDDIIAYRLS